MDASQIIQKDFIKVEIDGTVSTLVGQFRKKKLGDAVVLKNNSYAGVVRKRSFLRLKQDIHKMKIKEIVVKVPTLIPTTPIEEIPALMNSADVNVLPVVDGSEVKGVVTASSLLTALRKSFRGIKVFELINGPIVLEENEKISKAVNFFRQKRIDHLPIVGANGKLVGIVSVSDLITKYYLFPPKREQKYGGRGPLTHTWKKEDLTHLPIRNEIAPLIYSANKEDSVTKLIDIFKEKEISSVVIVEDRDVPVGIVTVKDLFKLYAEITQS